MLFSPHHNPGPVSYTHLYHRELKNLILVSAGLNATLNTGEHQVQISNGVPLGTLGRCV